MSVTLHLSADTERRLRERATSQGQSIEAYLERLAEQSIAGGNGLTAERSVEEWIAEFRAWVASHRSLPHLADDSRESIYAGRGE